MADGLAASAEARRYAPEEMARIMDVPPVLVPEILRDGTRLTQKWAHGPINAYSLGMDSHVIVGSYGRPVDISWHVEKGRFTSRTQRRGFTLIPEGVDGRWDIGPVTVSHVYLPKGRLQACADQISSGRPTELLIRVGFQDPIAAHLLDVLSQPVPQSDTAFRLFLEQAIDLLCLHLVRAHSAFGAPAAPAPRRGLADWQVRRVTEFMRAHLEQDIGLAELAALVHLSRYHFCTAFHRATGYTPHQWLTAERMTRARSLLVHTELSVTEIALAVGYETPSAFAASFRRTVGMTPSDFRRQMRS